MARPELLTSSAVADWLAANQQWTLDGVLLKRTVKFRDFSEAFAFMTRVAMLAEQLDHHPEWSNVYNTVDIALTTHDAGGITLLDTSFATAVDEILDGSTL